jgi:hypothetical protein
MSDPFTLVGELILKTNVTKRNIDKEQVVVLDEHFLKIEETIVLL